MKIPKRYYNNGAAEIANLYGEMIIKYGGFFPDARSPTDISNLSRKELMELREDVKTDVGIYEKGISEDVRKNLKYNSHIEELERGS